MPSTDESQQRGGGVGTPTEKPSHYRYLKEFRVDQCTLFPLHKCQNHRPYTCFNWHFPNQRRRRPVRRRDGTFNYSADTYCTNYDETTGTCPEGDDCPHLHRTAGDTERRYHLRYYKTCMCVYGTDGRGYCTENGTHCAFAHGDGDKRPPVFDAREQQQTNPLDPESANQLDKERMMVDDPKWQDVNYVLLNYKTEQCKRPPRICRQGYACPQYHNFRDRRRAPNVHKYRSTPCPNVKHGDEWGEPSICEDQDNCSYCHTRTEQQFHPEIYKSTKCHDMNTNNYCPRGQFCAFAHADIEMSINRSMVDRTFLDIFTSSPNPQQQQHPTPSVSIPESNNNLYNPSIGSYSAVASSSDTNKNNVLLMGSSLMDSLMNEDEGYSLFPVREREVEQPQHHQRVPTPINSSPPREDYESRPDSPGYLEKFGNMVGSGGYSVSPDVQFFYNNINGMEPTPLPPPPVMPPLIPPSVNGTLMQLMLSARQDLTYGSLSMLRQCKQAIEMQLDAVNKAISGHNIDSPHYPCLNCKRKDAYRAITLIPCDHQVVCIPCAERVINCPLCSARVRNRKNCGD